MLVMNNTLYSSQDIARITGKSRVNVQLLAKKYKKGRRVGDLGRGNVGQLVFTEADLKWFMQERKPGPKPKKKRAQKLDTQPND